MARRVVITGIGITCCLGDGIDEVAYNLEQGISGLKKGNYFDINSFDEVYFGKCRDNGTELTDFKDLEKIEEMAIRTINQCLEDGQLKKEDIAQLNARLGLSLSTSLAGIDHVIKSVESSENKGEWVLYCRRLMSSIMAKIGIGGTCYTTSSACAAGTAGAGVAFDMIRNDSADIFLVGGVDHLSLFSIMGFNSLNTISGEICKPFDSKRDGINLGEGACFFIFEELNHALKRSAAIYGEVLGYGLGNDAYHMTSPDPKGTAAKHAIYMAMKEAEIGKEENIYINAHGTGTQNNDSMELGAIKEIWKNEKIFVSSTKSRTGHCLGAAGSIELAVALCALKFKQAYPTIHSDLDMISDNDIIKGKNFKGDFSYALSNSFAFAGHAASVLIGEWK